MLVLRVERAGCGVGEPAVDVAGLRAGSHRVAADQGGGQVVLGQGFVQVGDDHGGGGGEAVEHGEHGRLDVGGRAVCRRDGAAREVEEVVAFVALQPERAGERGQGLGRRLGAAAAFQLGVVVRRQARELGDLLAAQPGHAAPGAGGQADIRRPDAGAAGLQERGQFAEVHPSMVTPGGGA